jgi:hypothetical protein
MDDYSALAQRTAVSVPEVRGCLILSRDGLVLGAYPDHDEAPAKAAWLRFCALGEPERSFIEFSDQTWAFVKRGPYGAFAVAEPGVRPGILVDQLEQVLLVAEEGRSKRDMLRVPDALAAPSGKPRTSMHPPTDRPAPSEVVADRRQWSVATPEAAGAQPIATGAQASPPAAHAAGSAPQARPADDPKPAAAAEDAARESAGTALRREPQPLAGADDTDTDDGQQEDDTEVDRVLLAKEFSGLLQMDVGDDEGSS